VGGQRLRDLCKVRLLRRMLADDVRHVYHAEGQPHASLRRHAWHSPMLACLLVRSGTRSTPALVLIILLVNGFRFALMLHIFTKFKWSGIIKDKSECDGRLEDWSATC